MCINVQEVRAFPPGVAPHAPVHLLQAAEGLPGSPRTPVRAWVLFFSDVIPPIQATEMSA